MLFRNNKSLQAVNPILLNCAVYSHRKSGLAFNRSKDHIITGSRIRIILACPPETVINNLCTSIGENLTVKSDSIFQYFDA